MKISRLLLTTTLFIGGGIIPIFNVEAGYLNSGESKGKAWGCDLSKKYVEINSEYTT